MTTPAPPPPPPPELARRLADRENARRAEHDRFAAQLLGKAAA